MRCSRKSWFDGWLHFWEWRQFILVGFFGGLLVRGGDDFGLDLRIRLGSRFFAWFGGGFRLGLDENLVIFLLF